MIKRKFKLVCMFLAVAGAFCLASCGSSSNADNQQVVNSTDIINNKAEEKQKYVIELNMNNYKKYIDTRAEVYTGSHLRYAFYGSLSYGFYDNVVITFERNYNEVTTHQVELSTGGYGYWYTAGYGTYTITAVSGKVIYWI